MDVPTREMSRSLDRERELRPVCPSGGVGG
jgi:hypothetical protein